MALKRIIAPATEPLTLDEVKQQCAVDHNHHDGLLALFLQGVREQAEARTGRALITQTWELVQDAFPRAFVLRHPPIITVESVKFIDPDGTQQTLDLADTLLDIDSEPGYLVPAYGKIWPESRCVPNAVRVRYTAGYGDASQVPQSIKTWMLVAITTLYENRASLIAGQVTVLPRAYYDAFIDPYVLYEAY